VQKGELPPHLLLPAVWPGPRAQNFIPFAKADKGGTFVVERERREREREREQTGLL